MSWTDRVVVSSSFGRETNREGRTANIAYLIEECDGIDSFAMAYGAAAGENHQLADHLGSFCEEVSTSCRVGWKEMGGVSSAISRLKVTDER